MKILDGYEEQDIPYVCPECNYYMELKDAIIIGSYPKGGYRSIMKPNYDKGLGFECPKCFTKSVCHCTDLLEWEFLQQEKMSK